MLTSLSAYNKYASGKVVYSNEHFKGVKSLDNKDKKDLLGFSGFLKAPHNTNCEGLSDGLYPCCSAYGAHRVKLASIPVIAMFLLPFVIMFNNMIKPSSNEGKPESTVTIKSGSEKVQIPFPISEKVLEELAKKPPLTLNQGGKTYQFKLEEKIDTTANPPAPRAEVE